MEKIQIENHYLIEICGYMLGNSSKGYSVLTYKTLIKSFKSTLTYLNSITEVKEVEGILKGI